MEKARQSISDVSRLVVAALVASLLVLVAPFQAPSQADYTSVSPGTITINDRVCNLGDPNDHSTSATAFEITNSDQLWEVTDCVSNSATIYFKLGNDIDVSDPAGTVSTASPIGSASATIYSFNGVLDGDNHEISGISMSNAASGVGLFAWLSGSTVSNLAISGAFAALHPTNEAPKDAAGALAVRASGAVHLISVSNTATVTGLMNVGGLVGVAANGIVISASQNAATVSSVKNHAGGLVGLVQGGAASVHGSLNTGDVTSDAQFAGGLIGSVDANGFGHEVYQSSNEGAVSGTSNIGGLLGAVQSQVTITSSHNIGNVDGSGTNVGGLVGRARTSVEVYDSTNTGDVSGAGQTGGLVGDVTTFMVARSVSNTGKVSGTFDVGGIVGEVSGNFDASFASNMGTVSGTLNNSFVGGLGGDLRGATSISYSYNVGTISGINIVGGIAGNLNGVTSISSSYNLGAVSASGDVGGLIGKAGQNLSAFESANLGSVSASGVSVGGLVGSSDQTLFLNRVFNTGEISGNNTVGGLTGLGTNLSVTESFTAGSLSASALLDALVGNKTGTVSTSSFYSSLDSQYVATTPETQLKLAATYVGFDFDNVWGFGACTLNAGFPVLRSLGLTGTPFSSECGSSSSSPSSQQSNSPAVQSGGSDATPAPAYVGPSFEIHGASGRPGASLELSGELLLSVTSISVGDLSVEILTQTDGSITILLPESLSAGAYDLVVTSSYGQLTVLGAIRVIGVAISEESTGQLLGFAWTGAFLGNSRGLSEAQVETIGLAIDRRSEATTIICWGYTTATEPKQWAIDHATQRAQAACDLVAKLNPEVKTAVRVRYGVEKRFAMRAALQFWKG